MSHFSYTSSKDIADILGALSPDSRIAHNMSCGPTKLSYLICFGIAPFIKQQLLADLKKAPCFVISFDESFNQELPKEQIDVIVRYFSKNKVVSRYLTSSFLGHTKTEDLKRDCEEAAKDFDKKVLAQVSMDGTNVNWKMYDKLVEERGENDQLPGLINVGLCGFHIVHGAFRSVAQKRKWVVDSILKALYKLFGDFPARREDYSAITGSKKFPLPFCGNR